MSVWAWAHGSFALCCLPAACKRVQAIMDQEGWATSCGVFVTFRHGGCAYGVVGIEGSFQTPAAPPPMAPSTGECTCDDDNCQGAYVCLSPFPVRRICLQ